MKTESKAKPIAARVRRRIQKRGPGSLFLVRDFLDLGSPDTIARTLSRLAQEGVLRRLQQGVYEYPRVSAMLGKTVPPDPAQVAAAMARRTGNEVSPSEAHIANALGITTQVPAKNIFRTNGGKTRRVKVGNQTIELRPAAERYFPANDGEAVLQGLRFVGEGNVTEDMVERLQGVLSGRQKAALRRKISDAPVWMRPLLERITKKEEATT
jgi:hypothetical protein